MDEAFVQLRNHACSQRRKPTDVAAQVAYPQSLRRKAVAGAICPPPPVGRAGQGASQAPSPPDPPCPRIRRAPGSAVSPGHPATGPAGSNGSIRCAKSPCSATASPWLYGTPWRSSCAATAGDGPANRSRSTSGTTATLGSRMSSAAAWRRVPRRCSTCGQ
ncbi:hypothetical protein [Streptomyces chrestomyceticus]|uniref:hypothetical protein n=1 Tax=Streptomyces chrestomyceticus TaxID=68185 RepID=UPI003408EB49